MGWNPAQTTGLTTGILVLILLITACAWIYYRHQNNAAAAKSNDHEAQNDSNHEPTRVDYASGTVRRTTGKPQTFSEWVQSSGDENGRHERYPSLENGPGPIISNQDTSFHSKPTTSRDATLTPRTKSVDRPVTRDSIGASSFSRAVLEAAGANKEEIMVEATLAKDHVMDAKAKEILVSSRPAKRGYSGAWP